MPTHCYVVLKVRKKDIGKTMVFDKEKLSPIVIEDWADENAQGDNLCQPIKITSQYIGIYSHWDGYINNGVGESLKTSFNSYDKALNLILGGDCSSIDKYRLRHYANRKYNTWEHIQPLQSDNLRVFNEQYVYLFNHGGWRVKKDFSEDFKRFKIDYSY